MREFTGRWAGSIRPGFEGAHEQFLDGLRADEGRALLQKCGLTAYTIYQSRWELEVIFKSDRPMIIAGFLRNRRLWPNFWEFTRAGEKDEPEDKPLIFQWARPEC